MKILSLNIRHGGGERVARLCDWLESKEADVIVLPEWRNGASGEYIRSRLAQAGLECRSNQQSQPRTNSIAVAAKHISSSSFVTPLHSPAGEMMLIELQNRVSLLACYFPQKKMKAPFFHQCIQQIPLCETEPFVLIGDLNTGRNDLDIEGQGAPFHCADLFEALSENGALIDLWRHRHGNQRDWTWRSSKNGFRIDHAFGNDLFLKRFPNFRCEIIHEPRLVGLSDHSAVLLDGYADN